MKIKTVMLFQLVFFVAYGLLSGSAFLALSEVRAHQEAQKQVASFLISMPLTGLGQIDISRKESI